MNRKKIVNKRFVQSYKKVLNSKNKSYKQFILMMWITLR